VNPVVPTVAVKLKDYSESCFLSGDSVPRTPCRELLVPGPHGGMISRLQRLRRNPRFRRPPHAADLRSSATFLCVA